MTKNVLPSYMMGVPDSEILKTGISVYCDQLACFSCIFVIQ